MYVAKAEDRVTVQISNHERKTGRLLYANSRTNIATIRLYDGQVIRSHLQFVRPLAKLRAIEKPLVQPIIPTPVPSYLYNHPQKRESFFRRLLRLLYGKTEE